MAGIQIDVEGSGPPLLLVHSLLTDARAFDPVAARFGTRYGVHRVWLPGFGNSEPLAGESLSIFDIAGAVADAMAEAGIAGKGATVLGNGFGAFVCVALAIGHGHEFGPLIVANGGAAFSPERRAPFTAMSDLVTRLGMDAVVDTAVRRIFTAGVSGRAPRGPRRAGPGAPGHPPWSLRRLVPRPARHGSAPPRGGHQEPDADHRGRLRRDDPAGDVRGTGRGGSRLRVGRDRELWALPTAGAP